MTTLTRLFLPWGSACLILLGGNGARAQEFSSDAALISAEADAEARDLKPTVTRAMGDAGGKFFGQVPDPAKTRRYYVAAEYDTWDYAPSGKDELCGTPIARPEPGQLKAMKLRYFQYTDATFTTRLMPTTRLGLMGPVLRGVTGETLAVTFLNRTNLPLSMHPHGVKYDKDSEGAYYQPDPGLGAAVEPWARFTYVWKLDEQSGPLPSEPSSKGWLYHSHVSGDQETNLGLVGFIIVTDPARARPDGTPADVDREMSSLFMIFNEDGLSEADLEGAGANYTWADLMQMHEKGARYSLNGRIFGNLQGLEMNEGERVRWYLFSLGEETGLHTAHWHGMRVVEEGRRRTDVIELLPASMKVADMLADNPGEWLFHCHVSEHMREGMFTRVTVHPKASPGVPRDSDTAFFGINARETSLHLSEAKLSANALRLTGNATVFEAFSLSNQPVTLRLGETSATLHPAANGVGTSEKATIKILNASNFGVVYGGRIDFEASLLGAEWKKEFAKLAALKPDESFPLTIEFGPAKHTVRFAVTKE